MQTTDTSNLFQSDAELSLNDARYRKAEQTKNWGDPIESKAKPLAAVIHGSYIWTAESGFNVRKSDLESGKTLQLYKGHSGPVTCLAFVRLASQNEQYDASQLADESGVALASSLDNTPGFLVTGSWDKTIKIWDTKTALQISSTSAHSDFVKCLLVDATLKILISGGSDKVVRFWGLENPSSTGSLEQLGSVTEHRRPVEALSLDPISASSGVLYTADSMGVVNVWDLRREYSTSPRCNAVLLRQVGGHRTGITALAYANRQLWTSSLDQILLVQQDPPSDPFKSEKPVFTIEHPSAVKAFLPLVITPLAEPYLVTAAGDVLRTYDVSTGDEPQLLSEVDAHWHDVTSLTLWARRLDGGTKVEYWVVSTSLDATIRKWRISDLLRPTSTTIGIKKPGALSAPGMPEPQKLLFKISEDEEQELAELMVDDMRDS